MDMNTIRPFAVFLLACCVQIGISSVDDPPPCELKGWYMKALADGLFDDDVDMDDAKSDVRIEVLQRIRRQKGFIYVSCADIQKYERILKDDSTQSDLDVKHDSTDIDEEYDDTETGSNLKVGEMTSSEQEASGINQKEQEKPTDNEIGLSERNAKVNKTHDSKGETLNTTIDSSHESVTDDSNKIEVTDKSETAESKETKEVKRKTASGDSKKVEEDTDKRIIADSKENEEETRKSASSDSKKAEEDVNKRAKVDSEETEEEARKAASSDSKKAEEDADKRVTADSEETEEDAFKSVSSDSEKAEVDTNISVTGDRKESKENARKATSSNIKVEEDTDKGSTITIDSEEIKKDTGKDSSTALPDSVVVNVSAELQSKDAQPKSQSSHKHKDVEKERNATHPVVQSAESENSSNRYMRGLDSYESLQFARESKSGYCVLTRAKECWHTPRRFYRESDLTQLSPKKDDEDTIKTINGGKLIIEDAENTLSTTKSDNHVSVKKNEDNNAVKSKASDITKQKDSENVNIRAEKTSEDKGSITEPTNEAKEDETPLKIADRGNETYNSSQESTSDSLKKEADSNSKKTPGIADSTDKSTLEAATFENDTTREALEESSKAEDSFNKTTPTSVHSANETSPKVVDPSSNSILEAADSGRETSTENQDHSAEILSETVGSINEPAHETVESKMDATIKAVLSKSRPSPKPVDSAITEDKIPQSKPSSKNVVSKDETPSEKDSSESNTAKSVAASTSEDSESEPVPENEVPESKVASKKEVSKDYTPSKEDSSENNTTKSQAGSKSEDSAREPVPEDEVPKSKVTSKKEASKDDTPSKVDSSENNTTKSQAGSKSEDSASEPVREDEVPKSKVTSKKEAFKDDTPSKKDSSENNTTKSQVGSKSEDTAIEPESEDEVNKIKVGLASKNEASKDETPSKENISESSSTKSQSGSKSDDSASEHKPEAEVSKSSTVSHKLVSKDDHFISETTLEAENSLKEGSPKQEDSSLQPIPEEDVSRSKTTSHVGSNSAKHSEEVNAGMEQHSAKIDARGKPELKEEGTRTKGVGADANSEAASQASGARSKTANATEGKENVGDDRTSRLSEKTESDTRSKQNVESRLAREQSDFAQSNADDVSDVTFRAESKEQASKTQLDEWFLNIEKRYSEKIESLEQQIDRMENQVLRESVDIQSKNSAIDQLEKHILRLETELLRFNQTFRDLQSEHEKFIQNQKTQIQQIGSSRELAEPNSSKKTADVGSSCLTAVEEQQTKIKHLSDTVQKQSSLLEKLQEKFHQVEGDNHQLVKQILNQSILMNEVLMKMTAMNQEQEWHKNQLKTVQESCEKSWKGRQTAMYDGETQTLREEELEILMGMTRFSSGKEAYNLDHDERPRIPKILDRQKVSDIRDVPDGHGFELKTSEPTLPSSAAREELPHSSPTPSMDIGHPNAFPSDESHAKTGQDRTARKYKVPKDEHSKTKSIKDFDTKDALNEFPEHKSDNRRLGEKKYTKQTDNNDVQSKQEDSSDLKVPKDKLSKTKGIKEIKDALTEFPEHKSDDRRLGETKDTKEADNNDVQSKQENSSDLKVLQDDHSKTKGIKNNEIKDALNEFHEHKSDDSRLGEVQDMKQANNNDIQPKKENSGDLKVQNKENETREVVDDGEEINLNESVKDNKNHPTKEEVRQEEAGGKPPKSDELKFETPETEEQLKAEKEVINRLLKPSSKSLDPTPSEESNIEKPLEKPLVKSTSPATEKSVPKETQPNIKPNVNTTTSQTIIKPNVTTATPSPKSPPVAREAKESAKVPSKENSKTQKSLQDAFPDPPIYERKGKDDMRDCYDHYAKGRRHNTPLKISPGNRDKAVEVFCDMKNGGWTVIQRRQDGTVDFFRKWDEYKNGFGNVYSEHWIGNEAIHLLTNQDHYSLRIELTDWDRNTHIVDYDRFRVTDEADGFRIFVAGYVDSPAGDSLTKHHGNRFSTMDVDNDLVEKEFDGNCAKRFTGAWWYFKCYKSNLNGKYYKGGSVDEDRFDGVAWKSWTGSKYSLKKVEMKIRPRSAGKS